MVIVSFLYLNKINNKRLGRDIILNEYMQYAYDEAHTGSSAGEGGPFGAVITDTEGRIIAKARNQVLLRHDPTAHAEIQAIRLAGRTLGTHDLNGCTLYATCEPCPMCLSAILWSNIKRVYYGCNRQDAAEIGFRDAMFYKYFEDKILPEFSLEQINRDECLALFVAYKKQGAIY